MIPLLFCFIIDIGDFMFSINQEFKSEIEVERSTFISYLIPIKNEENAKECLLKLRKDNPKARHICYAFCLEGNYKSSDDGEPKGTAGRPLQELLERRELNNVLLAVVRYFGGTLLGAGRLLRTYVDAGIKVIDNAKLLKLQKYYVYKVQINHSQYDLIRKFCTQNNVLYENVTFDESILLELYSESDIINVVKSFFNGNIKIEQNGFKILLK